MYSKKEIFSYFKWFILFTIVILFSTYYKTPLICKNNNITPRIFSFAVRDMLFALSFGMFLGFFIQRNIIKGILFVFICAPIIHYILGVDTMLNYHLGLSNIPRGLGYIPNCIIVK